MRVQLCQTGRGVQFSCAGSSAVSSWRGSSAVLRVQLCRTGGGVQLC